MDENKNTNAHIRLHLKSANGKGKGIRNNNHERGEWADTHSISTLMHEIYLHTGLGGHSTLPVVHLYFRIITV